MDQELLISVVVCTYNRCKLLRGCLKSLEQKGVDKKCYEVIIVNNNSTDSTQQVIDAYVERNLNWKGVIEPQQGLSYARNRGYREAKSDYVIYIDDDARADDQWLDVALSTIKEVNPDILGGPITPFYLNEKPRWFKDEYQIRSKSDIARDLTENEYASGANIAIKRRLLEEVGGFDVRYGMSGFKLGYGEEIDLQVRARKEIRNCKIYYQPSMHVEHFVPAHQMSVKYFAISRFISGYYFANFLRDNSYTKTYSLIRIIKSITAILYQGMIGIFIRDRNVYQYWQQYFMSGIAPWIVEIGKCYGSIRPLKTMDTM